MTPNRIDRGGGPGRLAVFLALSGRTQACTVPGACEKSAGLAQRKTWRLKLPMHKGGPYNFWGDNPGMLSLLQAEGEVGQPFLANICHKIMNQFPPLGEEVQTHVWSPKWIAPNKRLGAFCIKTRFVFPQNKSELLTFYFLSGLDKGYNQTLCLPTKVVFPRSLKSMSPISEEWDALPSNWFGAWGFGTLQEPGVQVQPKPLRFFDRGSLF